jgi:phosphoribosylformylglycinamidine synthase
MKALKRYADEGGWVLGICNGFQILTEAHLLPGALMRNASLKFVCREVKLEVANASTAFTRNYAPGQVIRCPVAHHDGNYVVDAAGLKRLRSEDLIALRYLDNPNGSTADIAGILGGRRRNVLGLMPHPERAVEPLQGSTDGLGLFRSLLESVG